MKTVTHKISLIVLTVIAFTATLYFLTQTYKSYQNYQVVKKSDLYLECINQLDTVVQSIEQERLLSALYLGYNGKIDFDQIALTREKSDMAISQLTQFLKQNSTFSSLANMIANIKKDLQYVRSRVDVINNEYNTILFTYYHEKITNPLLMRIKSLVAELSSALGSVKSYLQTYTKLAILRDNLSQEQSYLSFILARSQKMSMQDLVLWEKILKEGEVPDIKKIQNPALHDQLLTILQPEDLKQHLSRLRVGILRGINSGNYAITQSTWSTQTTQIITQIKKAQNNLYLYLQSIDLENMLPLNFIIKLILSIVALISFFLLLFMQKKSSQKVLRKSEKPDIQIKHTADISPKYAKSVSEFTPPSKEMPATLTQVDEADDLPLTNIQPQPPIEPKNETPPPEIVKIDEKLRKRDSEEVTFEPIKLFKEIIKPFVQTAQNRQIAFHYAIDPSLPTICIGDHDKIKELLSLFLHYAMEVTPPRKAVTFRIENIAQKKFDTALSFTIKDSGRFIDQEERRYIKRGYLTGKKLLTNTSKYANLLKASGLISKLDGNLQIESDPHKGTQFTISLNLKKYISTDF